MRSNQTLFKAEVYMSTAGDAEIGVSQLNLPHRSGLWPSREALLKTSPFSGLP